MNPKIIVHGGAWNHNEENEKGHIEGLKKSVSKVLPRLIAGTNALSIVEEVIKILEKIPVFDAGKGSYLNEMGRLEMDAIIVDAKNNNFGAVANLENFINPISVAKAILDKTNHCFIAGEGANRFALENGFKQLPTLELMSERDKNRIMKHKKKMNNRKSENLLGTVGAVVIDTFGNIAVGTSTGGSPQRKLGRIGDSPIFGAGAYADQYLGGVSATGWGEEIMRSLLSKTCCDLLESYSPYKSAELAIEKMKRRAGKTAGLIVVNKKGEIGYFHNTTKMSIAYLNSDKKVVSKISTYD